MSLNTPSLGGSMRDAFASGSGVDPSHLKLILAIATVALVAMFFGWLVMVTFDNYRQGELTKEEAVGASIKLAVLFSLIVWVVV